jgi:hypothetical protein
MLWPQGNSAPVRVWMDTGWPRSGCAINEFLFGAQPAALFHPVGPLMLDLLYRVGNAQQRHWAALGMERN